MTATAPKPLSDFSSEVTAGYRAARRIAFPLGVLAAGFAAIWFQWPAGWIIAGVLAVVAVRAMIARAGSIFLDTALDTVVLGIVTLFLEIKSAWIILAFPLAVVAATGRPRQIVALAIVTTLFGVAPLLWPEWFLLGQAEWVPSALRTSNVASGSSLGFASTVMVTFLLLVITFLSFRMRRLEEERTRLLAEAAHDLRNSVGAIHGLATVLAGEDLSDDLNKTTAAIASTAVETLQLSNDVLALARFHMRSGETTQFSLDELAIRVAQATPDVRAETAPVIVRADAGRTGQIIRNLIGNAIVHGSPPVVVRVHATAATAFVAVSDGGLGVPEAVERSVFAGGSRVGDGMGIGLATSMSFAEEMGGRITYHREAGRTTFELALPLVE